MKMNGAMGGFYKLSEWIMKLAYVNFLWIVFSFLGLVIFGLFPATTAMFVIVRKWLMGEDVSVFRHFWNSYKREFLKSNFLGLITVIAGYMLYVDLHFLRSTSGLINLFYYPTLVVGLGFVLTLFYVFPTFVHFDMKVFQVFKTAFLIMLMNPLSTALMVIGSIAVYLLMVTLPGLIPIFSGSALSLIIMWSAFFAFSRIRRKQETTI